MSAPPSEWDRRALAAYVLRDLDEARDLVASGRPGPSAEAMLLLGHPAVPGPERASWTRFFHGLSRLGDPLAARLADASWRVGVAAFSFPAWRHPARSLGRASLMEAAGYRRVSPRPTDALPEGRGDLYGPGFERRSGDVRVERRRAYVALSPAIGAGRVLLVGNASPHFGRDRLPSPAMLSVGDVDARAVASLGADEPSDPSRYVAWDDAFGRVPARAFPALLEEAEALLSALEADDLAFDAWLRSDDGRAACEAFVGAAAGRGGAPTLGEREGGEPPFSNSASARPAEGRVTLFTGEAGDLPYAVHPLRG